MAERYFGHAPRELKAAAVERYLTSDLALEEVGAQFGTTRSNISRWVNETRGTPRAVLRGFGHFCSNHRAANSPEYRNLSPEQVVAKLADEGRYICSERSLRRVLAVHETQQTELAAGMLVELCQAQGLEADKLVPTPTTARP